MSGDAPPPPEDKDLPLLLGMGAGILGIGLIAAAYGNNERRREIFFAQLAAGLVQHGLRYVSASFGRAVGNLPVWNVTFVHPFVGVQTVRVMLPAEAKPYAESTCAAVVQKVAAAI